ncbi:MAG TPA: hypothetical protein VGK73_15640, partial [Polyangiaceae bacterium]
MTAVAPALGCSSSSPSDGGAAAAGGAPAAGSSGTSGVPNAGSGGSSGGAGTAGAGGASPTGGSAGSGIAGTSGTAGSAGAGGSAPGVFINPNARVTAASNSFGIQGDWYRFADGVTSTESGNPYRDGMYCVTGTAPGDGDGAHWGAGIGLDLNRAGNAAKMPYAHAGKLTGFRMRLVGTTPAPVRVQFVTNAESEGVPPFIFGTFDESV